MNDSLPIKNAKMKKEVFSKEIENQMKLLEIKELIKEVGEK